MNTELTITQEPAHTGSDHRIVRRFEVLLRTGENSWEECSGPYPTYEAAEAARLRWFRKDEIPSMRVAEFYAANAERIHGGADAGNPNKTIPAVG